MALLDDGVVLALDHPMQESYSPRIERWRHDGSKVWQTNLPLMPISDCGVEARMPIGWRCLQSDLPVSGNLVLATYHEFPKSGNGFGYVLNLTDGAVSYLTAQGPLSVSASLGQGAFMIGFEGGGEFSTLLYDAEGQLAGQWPTCGHVVKANRNVRVIEMNRDCSSTTCLQRLGSRGGIIRGDRLAGYSTSLPYVRADGSAIFFRHGALHAARDLSIDRTLPLLPPDERWNAYSVVGNDDVFFVACFRYDSSGGDSALFKVAWAEN